MQHDSPIYIVAVSGGIDSVVLLHMLVNHDIRLKEIAPKDSTYIVAHINHGIRGNSSASDQEFVRSLSESYGLKFETCSLELGEDASEERARIARYEFLDAVAERYNASGLILAHHADDIIETAIINYIRGTGRRGLSALSSSPHRLRPLLDMTKNQVFEYASTNNLDWVEDESNQDQKYLRNRIRTKLKDADLDQKNQFATELQNIKQTNTVLDAEIAKLLQYKVRDKYIISRSWFVKLPHDLSCEIMHAVLTKLSPAQIDRQLVERLVIALKVSRPGTKLDIDKNSIALITKRSMRFVSRESLKTHSIQ